jgi:VIT1/CCC1 family predicted Fe2+/Mn2+ transporter
MTKEKNFWKDRLREWTTLDLQSRISEGLFGMIMVLTFTGTISVSTSGKQEISELLWAALGCNLAWGLVDAIMYLMDELFGRARSVTQLKRIKKSKNRLETREIVKENIPPLFADLMGDEDIDRLGDKLKRLPDITVVESLTAKEFVVAGQIFLLVFFVTFPVALPFIFLDDVSMAMRISNGIALVLLFAGGFALARYSGMRPVLTGVVYATIGIFLVSLTIALGG